MTKERLYIIIIITIITIVKSGGGVENVLTKEMHDKQINIRISDEMNRQLMLIASLNRVSKSDIAREAMRRFLGTGGNLK